MPRFSFHAPPVTLILMAAMLLMFVIEQALPSSLAPWGALWPVGSGRFEPWQVLTYAFVHADVAHLLTNLALLGMCGVLIERAVGSSMVALAFVVSTLAGAAASMVWMAQGTAWGLTVGASAFGYAMSMMLMGWIVADLWHHGTTSRWVWMPWMLMATGMLVGPDIAHWGELPSAACAVAHEAHVAGALVGAVMVAWRAWRGQLVAARPAQVA